MADKLTYEKVLAMFAETDRQLKAQFAETDKRLDKRFKETDRQLKETKELIKANASELYRLGLSNGAFVEEQYINALEDAPYLGDRRFAKARPNLPLIDRDKKTIGEIDILLESPDKIGIIEIKYKVYRGDIEELIKQKLKNYLKIYPQDAKKQIFLAIGGGSYAKGAAEYAQTNGVAVLKLQSGVILDKSKDLLSFGAPEPTKTLGKTTKKSPAKRPAKKK